MEYWIEVVISLVIIAGSVFILIGSIGLVRLKDFYMRLHAPTKATTLGIGSLLLASTAIVSLEQNTLVVGGLIISLFLSITAPVSAHMLAKAALHHKLPMRKYTVNSELAENAYEHLPPDAKKEQAD